MAPRLCIMIALSGALLACGTAGLPPQSPDRTAAIPAGVELAPPAEPSAVQPVEPVVPAEPAPVQPAEPPAEAPLAPPAEPPRLPRDECQRDSDCGPDARCVSRIIAACDVCAGGPVVRVCESQPQPSSCPKHISCMPPRPCPDLAELRKRCPDTQVVY